ncbi:FecR domain-containing protein [Steroidobacter sp. S1-65]|uniref:FecR domain-containing protein n=1 Tax=Steroidobacter gossypii TaxID=2805490 RepID=A0ABS1WXY9_9GAMM|nr:FecR domain-containing protein [Steroidobacter gossypii]MBM0105847.1 FecR domain-containing protein [Steroidobacter gossypii]
MSPRQDPVRAWIATQAQTWFVLHREGQLTAAQRQQFVDWLCESPAHAQEYVALIGFMQDVQHVAAQNTTDADVLIARARAEVDVDNVQPMFAAVGSHAADRSPPRRIRTPVWVAVAATVASVIVLLAGGWWFHERNHYQTAHAEQRSWRMPDGSTVHLNSSSEIRVRYDDKQRRVDLVRGQALFQVAKDAQRPFSVYAGDAVARAVGTEFDVYRRADRTLISVLEGRVAVWRLPDVFEQARHAMDADAGNSSRQPIAHLDADQQAMISGHSAEVSQRDGKVRKTVAWLQRQVVFDHDSLGSAIEEFNRYAERRIRVEGAELRSLQISGIFSAYDAEAFLRFLERQPDIDVQRGTEEIVVSAAPPENLEKRVEKSYPNIW